MGLFLDTGNIDEIKKYIGMGIVEGVTTNPTILMREGVTGGMEGVKKRSIEIAKLIAPISLSVELTDNNVNNMIADAKDIATWAENIVVKIPIHGPNGELDNLNIIHELETKHNVRVNVTAMMSAQQCYLAAKAGASYVSLFCGRIANMGYEPKLELAKLRDMLEQENLKAQIIAASTREIINVYDWLHAGAHIVTVVPKFIEGMIVHPYSKETVQMFMEDGEKLKK